MNFEFCILNFYQRLAVVVGDHSALDDILQAGTELVRLGLQQGVGCGLEVEGGDQSILKLTLCTIVGELRRRDLLLPLHILLAEALHLLPGLRHLALHCSLYGHLLQLCRAVGIGCSALR